MADTVILVVEDEPLVGLEIQECLGRKGFVVPEVVDSGDRVLEACIAHKPDLILMDIKLKSFIDGIDAASRVKLLLNIPVIYLTAYSTQEVMNKAKGTEPAAYLTKPFDEEELVAAIKAALERK